LGIRLWQQFLTVAGMVAEITGVLAGSAGGLLAALQAARGGMLGSEAAHDQSHASSGVGFG